MATREDLERVASLALGRPWQTSAARFLGMPVRTLRRWIQHDTVPWPVIVRLWGLLPARLEHLEREAEAVEDALSSRRQGPQSGRKPTSRPGKRDTQRPIYGAAPEGNSRSWRRFLLAGGPGRSNPAGSRGEVGEGWRP